MNKTNPIGSGTRNLTTNVPNDLYASIATLARTSSCKLGEYVRCVLEFAAQNELVAIENGDDHARWLDALKSPGPLPKVRREIIWTGKNAPPTPVPWLPDQSATRGLPPAGTVVTTGRPGSSTPSLNEEPKARIAGPRPRSAGSRKVMHTVAKKAGEKS